MTREEAKQLLPIIKAFSEGKVIQSKYKDVENDGIVPFTDEGENINFDFDMFNYRIKSSPKYRSFANAEECWQEMQKHQPFGWVKDKDDGHYVFISYIDTRDGISFSRSGNWSFADVDKYYIFADGSVFGIEES